MKQKLNPMTETFDLWIFTPMLSANVFTESHVSQTQKKIHCEFVLKTCCVIGHFDAKL